MSNRSSGVFEAIVRDPRALLRNHEAGDCPSNSGVVGATCASWSEHDSENEFEGQGSMSAWVIKKRLVIRKRLAGALLMILAYLALQTFVVIAHEFTHSTSAWLLGYMPSPFTVVWGNPITVRGWDEGVPYDRLFPSAGNFAEAVIGGGPLLMHAIFIVASLYFLQRPPPRQRSLVFFTLYWFVVINLAELISYIVMRPFIPTGDTGRFSNGMAMSPWVLFIVGTTFLVLALWVFARRVGSKLDIFTDGSRSVHWTIVSSAAFIMFLWGSGLRIMSLYPDPQWKIGLVGIAAFFGWILADRFVRQVRRA